MITDIFWSCNILIITIKSENFNTYEWTTLALIRLNKRVTQKKSESYFYEFSISLLVAYLHTKFPAVTGLQYKKFLLKHPINIIELKKNQMSVIGNSLRDYILS